MSDHDPITCPCATCWGKRAVQSITDAGYEIRWKDMEQVRRAFAWIGDLLQGRSMQDARIIEIATHLCIAWERGRLEANRSRWVELQTALEEAGELGFYGMSLRPDQPDR